MYFAQYKYEIIIIIIIQSFRIQLKIGPHLTYWTRRNRRDKVWDSVNSPKWRFRGRRHRCCSIERTNSFKPSKNIINAQLKLTVNHVYSKSIKHTTYIFNHIKVQRASNISLACLLAAVVWDRTKSFYDILSLKYFVIFCCGNDKHKFDSDDKSTAKKRTEQDWNLTYIINFWTLSKSHRPTLKVDFNFRKIDFLPGSMCSS